VRMQEELGGPGVKDNRPPHTSTHRIAALPRYGSARRDRAQTISRARRTSARREGKGRGCGPPAV
jgi:hypothetical protein